MKLWLWQRPECCALILDTGGRAPGYRARGLVLCRSFTLDVDRILLGPMRLGDWPEFLCLSDQGQEIPAEMQDGAAFLSFLAAAGYGRWPGARCQDRIFRPDGAQSALWHGRQLTDRELRERLSL